MLLSKIIITHGQTDEILGRIEKKDVLDNKHDRNMSTWEETFNFTAFADRNYTEFLENKNRVVIPDEDGSYRELSIEFSDIYEDDDGVNLIEINALGTYQGLIKSKLIP